MGAGTVARMAGGLMPYLSKAVANPNITGSIASGAISGLPALIAFEIPVTNCMKYKTLITQEMLKCGILAANSVYVCTAHTPALVNEYLEQLDPVLSLIRDCEDGRSIDLLLQTPVCHSNFHRLN